MSKKWFRLRLSGRSLVVPISWEGFLVSVALVLAISASAYVAGVYGDSFPIQKEYAFGVASVIIIGTYLAIVFAKLKR